MVRELVTFDDAVVAVATVHCGAAGLGAAADASVVLPAHPIVGALHLIAGAAAALPLEVHLGSLQLQAGRHLSGLGQLAARVLGLLAHQFKAVLGGATADTRRGARTAGQGADCSNPAAVAGGKGAGARVGTTPDGGPLEGVGRGTSQGWVHHRRPAEGSSALAAAVAATADTVPKGRGTATAQLLALGGHLLQGTAGGLTGSG